MADAHDTHCSTEIFGESSINIRQAHEEQLAELGLLLDTNPILSSADAASTRPDEVRVLLVIIINEANEVSTFLPGHLPKFGHIQYVQGATSS